MRMWLYTLCDVHVPPCRETRASSHTSACKYHLSHLSSAASCIGTLFLLGIIKIQGHPSTKPDISLHVRKTHADIEPIVVLLMGQLTIDDLNYTFLIQCHLTRSPLSELIRSTTVEINNVPSDCSLTDLCWLVEHAKTGHV